MRREWEPEELIASWTLLDDDWRLVGNKTGATRLGFSVILTFFAIEARFPRHAGEVPKAAVDYVAGQVRVNPALWGGYDWSGRSIEWHRAQIREELGFREATRDDEDSLIEWLAAEICPVVLNDDGVTGSAAGPVPQTRYRAIGAHLGWGPIPVRQGILRRGRRAAVL